MPSPFIRKTTLAPGEYQANFTITDNDIIDVVTSDEALSQTALLPAIYFRLKRAPIEFWEREGVLRFTGSTENGAERTAWEQMRELAGVSNSTLSKAVKWLHEQGIIGYLAHKNGVGIRIFFNRAAASIRRRPETQKEAPKEQKNLRLVPAPSDAAPAPPNGMPFKELGSKRDLEVEDPRARGGKSQPTVAAQAVSPTPIAPASPAISAAPLAHQPPAAPIPVAAAVPVASGVVLSPTAPVAASAPAAVPVGVVVRQVLAELQPELNGAVKRESEALKAWFLNNAVPKAVRVAQREAYDVLRAYGLLNKPTNQSAYVGANNTPPPPASGAGKSPQASSAEPSPQASSAEPSPHAEVAAFLATTSLGVQRFAAHCPLSTAHLRAACEAVGGELGELREQLLAGSVATPDELEARLQTLESGLTEALWQALEAAEREALLQTSRSELKQYAERMEREVFAQTVRKRALAKLRERYKLPRLSLFYR